MLTQGIGEYKIFSQYTSYFYKICWTFLNLTRMKMEDESQENTKEAIETIKKLVKNKWHLMYIVKVLCEKEDYLMPRQLGCPQAKEDKLQLEARKILDTTLKNKFDNEPAQFTQEIASKYDVRHDAIMSVFKNVNNAFQEMKENLAGKQICKMRYMHEKLKLEDITVPNKGVIDEDNIVDLTCELLRRHEWGAVPSILNEAFFQELQSVK